MAKKSKFDISLLIIGIVAIFYGLSDILEKEERPVLKRIEIELADKMQPIKGRRRSVEFEFRSKEHRAIFAIPTGGIIDDDYGQCRQLQKGQRLTIFIKASDVKKLPSDESKILIRGLSTPTEEILSTEEFHLNRLKYRHRMAVFVLMGGFIVFTRAIPAIKKRLNYTIIVIILIVVVITMRALNIGLY